MMSGLYDTDPTPLGQRRREDYFDHVRRRAGWAAMLAYEDSIAVGQVALTFWEVEGLPRNILMEITRRGRRKSPGRGGVVVRQYGGFETYRLTRGRGRECVVAAPLDAMIQALPDLPRGHGVAALSNAMRRGLIHDSRSDELRAGLKGRRGAVEALRAVDLASPMDESPAESVARVSLIDNGVPPDRVQVRFVSGGRVVARCDFAWCLPDGRWLVVEIDGVGPHSTARALVQDAPRQNGVVGTGRVVLLRFKPADNDRPGGIGRQVATRLKQLGWRPDRHVPEGDIPI